MQILDEDGLATPGEIIRQNDIYFIDVTNLETRKKYTGPEGKTCSVDRVALFSHEDMLHFRFLIRHSRQPEIGDIFSSRHGQKGVCGAIVGQEDLPFTEEGICPDLTINPASGEAVGMMIEVLEGKVGASFGKVDYGNAFAGHADRVEAICDRLVKHGFNYSGKDFIYSGTTGEQLETYIFMGPIYYQRSKHMVIDKMRARSGGPRSILTRQPKQGESKSSAPVWFGEMERDCLIAHGASMAIFERLMISSDPTQVEVCRECGSLGYYNHELKLGVCSTCKNANNTSTIQLPYAFKLLIQELQSINVVPRLKLEERRGD
ncbi:hypothetical protein Dsin_006862 [Dipteronia sinensis]|uniref:DNA-directed RNA polymerase n=1 Tax=Dipteronia sinensis TaxID=43782 RepID=A0AAE0B050_9ROSI|nr:hypothetical protein Dsin_006862 [Dipteronia sinensis]